MRSRPDDPGIDYADRPGEALCSTANTAALSTGNISNKELETLLIANFDQIISDLTNNRFIEFTQEHVIVHV